MPCNTPQGEIEWFEKQYGTNNPDKLRDMLCRVLNEIGHQEPGIVLDQDIKDWFVKIRSGINKEKVEKFRMSWKKNHLKDLKEELETMEAQVKLDK